MTERIIDISNTGARLSVRLEQLVIQRPGEEETTTPLAELAVLVVSNKAVLYTHAVFAELAARGGVFIVCNDQHLPIAMMLPLVGHHRQSERFEFQAAANPAVNARIWKQLIKAKIELQGRILKDLRGDDHGLLALAKRVKNEDPENIEGHASRRYWPALFDNPNFRRNRDASDQNRFLNYGYAILRAMVARAICAAGLHPSLGVHHSNRYDPFPLADDLMEPFRPLVDRAVVGIVEQFGPNVELNKEIKATLISAVTDRFYIEGELRSMWDILFRMAASLAQIYEGKRNDLLIPDI